MGIVAGVQGASFVRGYRPGLYDLSTVLVGVWPVGVCFGLVAGWLGMSRAFQKHLQPLLRARPARAQGLFARCRCCGADLPPVRAPQVACRFCAATNFLDEALVTRTSDLLQAEAAEHHQRVSGWSRDPSVYNAPSRAFYWYGGVVALLTTVVVALAVVLVG
jgi:hypothetical protein